MNFEMSSKSSEWLTLLNRFMADRIYPLEDEAHTWFEDVGNLWKPWPMIEALKDHAKSAGLWNLFLPTDYLPLGSGLSNLEYAPLAEAMGRVYWASEVFNCSPPDTGNMEVLARYGSEEQKDRWLAPLLNGHTRSAFAMSEPAVASSDATNLETTITPDGDHYVVDGCKWWTSGIMDPRCDFLIVMGKTADEDSPRHARHSMIIVPRNTPGVEVDKTLKLFGRHSSPGGHGVVKFNQVRVPASCLILGEGRGFEVAQGRLGPGRIHHSMRSIGQAQRMLELMSRRASSRYAFGRRISDQSSVRQDVALSWCEIEMARLLTLKAADCMDRVGNKEAMDLIAAIKIVGPRLGQSVGDRAIQIHGAMGVSDDTPLAMLFTTNRALRLTDGPDEVHMGQLGRMKMQEYSGYDDQGRPAIVSAVS